MPDFQVRLLAGSVRLAPVQCGALAVGPDTRVLTLPTCACESATSPHPQGNRDSIRQVATSGLDVFAHNVETVQRLQPVVRDRRANWAQSLGVLAAAKDAGASITKTSIMLGCGEHQEEVRGPWFTCLRHCCSMAPVGCFASTTARAATLHPPPFLHHPCAQVLAAFEALRAHGVDVLTLGQYMRPTKKHMAVSEYVTPAAFAAYQAAAEAAGFLYVASGPLVRSSYRAGEFYLKNVLQGRAQAAAAAAAAVAAGGGGGGGASAMAHAG